MEKKIVPMVIIPPWRDGAILVNHFGNKKKKRIAWGLLGLLFFGTPFLFAEKAAAKENYLKQVLFMEARGIVNVATSPGEVVIAYTTEKADHPMIWPASYVPRLMMNFWTRILSGVSDIFILPWYAWALQDTTPLTRSFDYPDYIWQKE